MWRMILLVAYQLAAVGTFIYQIADDWDRVNGLAWLIVVPLSAFLASIWPIYWLLRALGM